MPPAWDRKRVLEHHVSAFRIDPTSGALSPHGAPISLPHRPIHMATDIPSEHVLVAFNNPPGVRVYRIEPDATLGAEVLNPPTSIPVFFRIRCWRCRTIDT